MDKKQMPEEDPQFWSTLIDALNNHGPAAALAFVVAYLRIIFDSTEPRPFRQLLEAMLGACITLVIGLTCESFGWSPGWSYATAGAIGVLGVNQVRTLAQHWARKRIAEK